MSRVPAIFRGLVIATAGPMPDQFTEEKLKQWTEMRRGHFSKEWNESVTHLLCTTEQFKSRRKNPRIKDALTRGKRSIAILHVDWYEFSCVRGKRLPTKDFTFDRILAKEQAKLRKQKAEEQAIRNYQLGERWINPDLYRVFIDKHQFEYKVELFRSIKDEFGTYHQKYLLLLHQSYAKPYLYWFAVKVFKKKDDSSWRPAAADRPSECPAQFKPEFTKFKQTFRRLTGIDWPDRILKAGTTEQTVFQYTPPSRGKPVGGNLAGGLSAEESFARNLEKRRLWHELFADEPDDKLLTYLAAEEAAVELLEKLIDMTCCKGGNADSVEGNIREVIPF